MQLSISERVKKRNSVLMDFLYVRMYDKETLEKFDVSQLSSLASMLKFEISNASQHLVHSLVKKDTILNRISKLEKRLTELLVRYASNNDLDINLRFSISINFDCMKFQKWLNAWMIVSRIKKGIPKRFRNRVWLGIANYYTRCVCWENVIPILFHGKKSARDQSWIDCINKTAYDLNSKYVSHSSVERVLLAYSRHNSSAEFTPELCILSSLVLNVMEGEEESALKVIVYLLDYNLPPAYFSNKLLTISTDMYVLNDLLSSFFPQLFDHLQQLRNMNCVSISKCYSYKSPPSWNESFCYEPPLTNAFVFQWFLYMFTTCLSWKALRRLFDAIIIYKSDILIYAAIAVWGIFEMDILDVQNVPDYYIKVGELTNKLKSSELVSSVYYIMTMYSVYDCAQDSSIPSITELRKKHSMTSCTNTYGPCPFPSQGGAVMLVPSENKKTMMDSYENVVQCFHSIPVMSAKAECPQIIARTFMFANSYAADIPDAVLSQYFTGACVSDDYMKLLKEGQTFKIDSS